MFTINDVLMLDLFKEAHYLIHEDSNILSFKEIFPLIVDYDIPLTYQLPILDLRYEESRLNHIRLTLKNRKIEAIILVFDDVNTEWINQLFNEGISIIYFKSKKNYFVFEVMKSISDLTQQNYGKLLEFTDFLEDYQGKNITYIEILKKYKSINTTDCILTTSNYDVITSTFDEDIYVEFRKIGRLNLHTVKSKVYYGHLIYQNKNHHNGILIEVNLGEKDHYNLIILVDKNKLFSDEFLLIEEVAFSIQLEFLKRTAYQNLQQSNMNEIFDNILNGKYSSNEELLENAILLGLNNNNKYRIITFGFIHRKTKALVSGNSDEVAFDYLVNHVLSHLTHSYPHSYKRVYSNRITLIISDGFENDFLLKRSLEDTTKELSENFIKNNIDLKVGVSEQSNLNEVSLNAVQSLQVIKIAQFLESKETIIFFNSLGIYKMFVELQRNNALESIIPPVLYDIESFNIDFLETLEIFLENNQNFSITAKDQFIHPKTVRYRIKKIEEVFNLNLKASEIVLNLQLGIRAYNLKKSGITL